MQISLRKPDFDLPELQGLDFDAVVAHKAKTAAEAMGRPCLVDDAGLLLDAYPGFPGPLTGVVVRALGCGRHPAAPGGRDGPGADGLSHRLLDRRASVALAGRGRRPPGPASPGTVPWYGRPRPVGTVVRAGRARPERRIPAPPQGPGGAGRRHRRLARPPGDGARRPCGPARGMQAAMRVLPGVRRLREVDLSRDARPGTPFPRRPPHGAFRGLPAPGAVHRGRPALGHPGPSNLHGHAARRLLRGPGPPDGGDLRSAGGALRLPAAAVRACPGRPRRQGHLLRGPRPSERLSRARRRPRPAPRSFPTPRSAPCPTCRRRWFRQRPYLFLQTNEGRRFVYDAGIVPSQYVRRIITRELGMPERWHWREYLGLDELKRTFAALSGWRPSHAPMP